MYTDEQGIALLELTQYNVFHQLFDVQLAVRLLSLCRRKSAAQARHLSCGDKAVTDQTEIVIQLHHEHKPA